MNNELLNSVKKASENIEEIIISKQNENGYWEGFLSSSALSTAVAVFALWLYDKEKYSIKISNGLNWLAANVNDDGAWGDTTRNKSNLSTTLLCWAAFSIDKEKSQYSYIISNAEKWILKEIGTLNPKQIAEAVLNHYQTDKTFSVPILTMCALAGRLGDEGWNYVPQLPFQLALIPENLFRKVNLNVVSYAIPALISMGLVKQKKKKSNVLFQKINNAITPKVLKILAKKQPENGGFLEATPLTSFVTMSLIGAGIKNDVCDNAVCFLDNSVRSDGSWPIDTNLATWVTTLTVNSLSEKSISNITPDKKKNLYKWLINQQYTTIHPFTKTLPGGWAWTNLPGGVPDCDDTSGALLALSKLEPGKPNTVKSAMMGIEWLIGIQNKDGGFPTFCKGWGKLPFDASCPDITAHAIQTLVFWSQKLNSKFQNVIKKSIFKSIQYLKNNQLSDGSWLPLWFGNEEDINHLNPVYGTSQVIYSLNKAKELGINNLDLMIKKGSEFLLFVQNSDGSWGGNINVKSSIEETALAVRALNNTCKHNVNLEKGIYWLLNELENWDKEKPTATPIGLYFASLWYYEEMYPLVFTCSALNEVLLNNSVE